MAYAPTKFPGGVALFVCAEPVVDVRKAAAAGVDAAIAEEHPIPGIRRPPGKACVERKRLKQFFSLGSIFSHFPILI